LTRMRRIGSNVQLNMGHSLVWGSDKEDINPST